MTKLKALKILLIGISLCLSFIGILLSSLYLSFHSEIKAPPVKIKGLWARHAWVGEQKSEEEYKALAQRLLQFNITDVFFHVGPLNGEGKIENKKYPFAPHLLSALKKHYPTLRRQAWIGQLEKKSGGPLNLSDARTMKQIVDTSAHFLELGFDGIHYNIEPIYSGDQRWIELLKRTHQMTRSKGKLLSIAGDEIEPFWTANWWVTWISASAGFWSEAFYREINPHVDQIALMMYDTALPRDWLYAKAVEREVHLMIENIDKPIFIGLPSYEEYRWGFHPDVENLRSGSQGMLQAFNDYQHLPLIGPAIYASWTTDEQEWEEFGKIWN